MFILLSYIIFEHFLHTAKPSIVLSEPHIVQMSFFGLTVKELFCICIQSLLPAPSPHAFIHSSGSVNIPFSSIIDVFTLYIAPFALPLFYIIIHILVFVNHFLPYNVRDWFDKNQQILYIVFLVIWVTGLASLIITPCIQGVSNGIFYVVGKLFGLNLI